jgi:Cu(I)/Ag(I) efflux system membrane fusion protein
MAPVRISPYKQQLIGIRFATVQKAPITRVIHTGGRFAGGEGDFAALAGDFAARNTFQSPGRYVVADVYALDLPFVKTGQKAVVTSLSGSGERVEGKITLIYPYDETQSRVTRVRVALNKPMKEGLFANVDIEAVTEPHLSLPPSAVMDTGTHRYVFIQTEPGTFSPREITVGYQGSDLWEVTSGLKEGDQVVDGANFLIDADSKITSSFSGEK